MAPEFDQDRSGTAVIHCSYPGYYEENNYLLTTHYRVLWDKPTVPVFLPSAFIADYQAIVAGVDHILWISFAGAEERSARMEETLSQFPSIARRASTPSTEISAPSCGGFRLDAIASAPEIARCLSHLKALSEAAAMEGEHFLILEDDANLTVFPFLGRRDAIAGDLERAPHDWQAISIGWVYTSELDRDFTDWNLSLEDGFHIAGAAAYLINRAGLEKMQSLFERRGDTFFLKPANSRKVLNAHYDQQTNGSSPMCSSSPASQPMPAEIASSRSRAPESLAALDRHDWYKKTSSILLNTIADEIFLSAEEWPDLRRGAAAEPEKRAAIEMIHLAVERGIAVCTPQSSGQFVNEELVGEAPGQATPSSRTASAFDFRRRRNWLDRATLRSPPSHPAIRIRGWSTKPYRDCDPWRPYWPKNMPSKRKPSRLAAAQLLIIQSVAAPLHSAATEIVEAVGDQQKQRLGRALGSLQRLREPDNRRLDDAKRRLAVPVARHAQDVARSPLRRSRKACSLASRRSSATARACWLRRRTVPTADRPSSAKPLRSRAREMIKRRAVARDDASGSV